MRSTSSGPGERIGLKPYERDDLHAAAARVGARLPTLFIIGAPRCGTTSLHHFLNQHPSVFMSQLKEPGYFVPELEAYPKDPEWYVALFEGAGDAAYVGEGSTHYTKLPVYRGVPERIARCCDDPRFIYLMRDPIDRALSHYWHATRQNAEFRSPRKAIEEKVDYRAFSDYARQLEAYFEYFDREDVFVATFESLTSDPETVMSKIYRWLELDDPPEPARFPRRNATPEKLDQFQGGQALGEFLHGSRVWNVLSPLVPQALKDLAKKATWQSVEPSDYPVQEIEDDLRPWAREVVERTSRLLGRNFPEWSTTHGGT